MSPNFRDFAVILLNFNRLSDGRRPICVFVFFCDAFIFLDLNLNSVPNPNQLKFSYYYFTKRPQIVEEDGFKLVIFLTIS